MTYSHAHGHDHGHATPCPQPRAGLAASGAGGAWSILRMTVVSRLAAAVAVSAALWAVVWLAMR